MHWSLYLTGLFWGMVSAVSLPLGALIGLWTKPSSKKTSALMAFGAGALLFALTIELFGHALHKASDHHAVIFDPWIIVVVIIAAAVGGCARHLSIIASELSTAIISHSPCPAWSAMPATPTACSPPV